MLQVYNAKRNLNIAVHLGVKKETTIARARGKVVDSYMNLFYDELTDFALLPPKAMPA